MKHFKLWVLLGFIFCLLPLSAQTGDVTAIHNLLNRIGGKGAADRFAVAIDPSLGQNGQETFVITTEAGKPCIKGSTPLAVTTGINWYLNHYAHVNLTWNQLSTDLTTISLPTPAQPETRSCSMDYRYYLNYCTFSYSMSTWTWERWQQEIDWMALHGINMPLQIVGLDVVWQKLLTQDLGYTQKEANDFIAGPCFQAWWGMNNLEGWGGPNPEWWYERQEKLAKNILARQRELGMQPVLPGYSGMVPSNITQKEGYAANNQGKWCNFLRPYILDPNSPAFTEVSELYYKRLKEVMGTSEYYSMDPFHEGANTTGIDVPSAYSKIAEAMTKANNQGKWVIQFWQWGAAQYNVLDKVKKGKLIVLDLFSDAHTHFNAYKGHDAVYCALPNFGGRTGLFGRLSKIMTHFYEQKAQFKNIKGIGTTPEAIEQTPVIYDALFELPWRETAPNPQDWVKEYTISRYGVSNTLAQKAWEKVRNTALNCETGLQGPHEAVLCARPALQVGSVSSWGGAEIFYDAQELADAAYLLLQAQKELSGNNYSYDLADFARQALTDYGNYLLKAIKQAHDSGNKKAYAQRRDAYLQLILDLDELLNTNKNFMLGNWTQMARGIADEVSGTTAKDKDWLELNNARTLITTWGAKDQSEWGGLRDYSYREWGGMMKDFYYQRWKTFFTNLDKNQAQPDWFNHDWSWAHNGKLSYSNQPVGNTATVAEKLFNKYFVNVKLEGEKIYHAYRCLETDARNEIQSSALRGETYTLPVVALPKDAKATLGVDFNNDNNISKEECVEGLSIKIPADAVAGNVLAQFSLSDGTVLKFKLTLRDEIKKARTVSVKTADEKQGRVEIVGSKELSVTNKSEVTIKATPVSGFNFANWTDGAGQLVTSENPYTYLGAKAAEFTANFVINKWGSPQEDKAEWGTIKDYGQFLTFIKIAQNDSEEQTIYTAATCPENLCQTTQLFNAAKGSEFAIHWKDNGGMNYCRLSAYIDLNADGDFEDEGEFLTVLGTKANAGNHMLNEHTLKVLLPYEIPEGVTHVRLRFDGAWQTSNLNAHDAVPAKAKTMRMVYDLPVNVTTQAATACTVTVKSENTALGTVDANGQPDTYTYKVGEEVVLRCYPAEGYYLKNWTDKYGRVVPKEWMEGNFLRFHAPENNTYTAHFTNTKPGTLAFGDWEMEIEEGTNGIRLNKISHTGDAKLDLTTSKTKVTGIAPDLFHNQTTLAQVILPASLLELDNLGYEGTVNGSGEQQTTRMPKGIKGNQPWTMLLKVENGNKSFNQWGSTLLATGNDPFANSFPNGFQFYLKAGKDLIVKLGDKENVFTKVEGDFSLTLNYDGKEKFEITLTRSNEKTETLNLKQKLNDISTLSYGLPSGINLPHLGFYYSQFQGNPFLGCTALTDIKVEKGNFLFADQKGVLFNTGLDQLLCYPQGRLYTRVFTLKNKTSQEYMTATPSADTEGNLIATDANGAERQASTTADLSAASLWKFSLIEGKDKLYHYNSKGFMGGKADNGGEGQILEVLANPQWAGNYDLQWNAATHPTYNVSLNLNGQSLALVGKDHQVQLAQSKASNANLQWLLDEVTALDIDVPASQWTSVSFPVATLLPAAEEATVYKATGIKDNTLVLEPLAANSSLAAGEGVLVKSDKQKVTFKLSDEKADPISDNILEGAQARRTGYAAQSIYLMKSIDGKMVLKLADDTATPNNSAFLLAKNVPGAPDSLGVELVTGIEFLKREPSEKIIYDLSGRRIHKNPTSGIYIINGQKQRVK